LRSNCPPGHNTIGTAEKTLKPQHVTVLGATKDNRSTRSTLQERHAAQDQGPHDALTKFRFRNH
jgi:hypothetical protein